MNLHLEILDFDAYSCKSSLGVLSTPTLIDTRRRMEMMQLFLEFVYQNALDCIF